MGSDDHNGIDKSEARKRPNNDGGNVADLEHHESEASESKRPKRTVQQEIALEELSNCDAIIKSDSVNSDTKMRSLSLFFESILNHNINIILLKEDFNEWVKSATLQILQGVHVTSSQFFAFLKSVLRTAPTIFESICDQVLTVAMFYPKNDDAVYESYDEFMKLLVCVFEKLRRFPKLIAKLLCCMRDYDEKKSRQKCSEPAYSIMMPPGFINSIGPVICLLPGGQIIDLWKTLHHNITEECLNRMQSPDKGKPVLQFLRIITQILVEFFKNVKLAEAAVPGTILEKSSELMLKFQNECLRPLGVLALQKDGLEIRHPFLELAYTWAELNGLLLHYNAKYKTIAPALTVDIDSSSTNVTYLHPYLTSCQWNKLAKILHGTSHYVYVSKLVAQKLKYIVMLDKSKITSVGDLIDTEESTKQLVQEHMKNAVNFLREEQTILSEPTIESMEICSLVAEYMASEEIMQLGNRFITKIANRQEDIDGSYYDLINSAGSQHFHCGLVLESLWEVLRRVGKMKILKTEMKAILSDILTVENRSAILQTVGFCSKDNSGEDNQKECIISLVNLVNEIVEKAIPTTKSVKAKARKQVIDCNNEEFANDLVCDMLKYLGKQPIDDYPLHLKTVIFLCSVPIMLGIAKCASKDLLDIVGHIFIKSGSSLHGNAALFALKWTVVFKWFCEHFECFSDNVQKGILNVILRNIYISPKSVKEFEEEFNDVCESEIGLIALLLLEFLNVELKHGAKTKLTHQLQTHTRKLIHFVVKSLQESMDDIGNYGQFNASLVEARSYRSCLLVQISMKTLSSCEIGNSEEDIEKFKLVLSKKVLQALSFLINNAKLKTEVDASNTQHIAFDFLHSVCKAKEEFKDVIPVDFVLQLWTACMNFELSDSEGDSMSTLRIPKLLLKDIYEAANKDEFEEISSLIVKMVNQQSSSNKSDPAVKVLIRVLDDLIDAELISEKKQSRWKTLEECLNAFLVLSLQWEPTEENMVNIVLPFVRFQTKLLRRRRPMGDLTTLATCLATVAVVPIHKITDLSLYTKVFCSLADLLNSFALHRLDVISFRTHIFLQCFQFLIENLFGKADQKNNLSDLEIFHMRNCAHSMERICQSVKLGQKEFSRISPYFVAILVRQLEQCTVYPVVKNPLLSGCYKLLDLCDEHGIAQLNSMLTAGSREVFKPIYEMYKRFYRYKGRV